MRFRVRLVGILMFGASMFLTMDRSLVPLITNAAAQEAEECDVCALRHQRLTRGKNANGSSGGMPFPELIWLAYESDSQSHSLAGRLREVASRTRPS